MVSHSDIATRRRATWLRWVLPTIIVGLIIVGRLFCFVYRQPTPSGSSYHLMSRIAQPHRGNDVLLSLTADSLAGSKLMLRVVGEPSDTLRFAEGKLLVLGKRGRQTFIMPLPQPLQQSSYEVILAADEYWLLAKPPLTAETIDSRHLGPIHRSAITATVIW
ncbi:S26 family signal peptidase [uncultured Porphyromonas sp.]|uniref:S26 family signal peptidase n=1 Tax=uncultured Porphyromonas sp. TaxID=159274 RepID=UPI002623B90A|nr:S26 family signal peptidase [uncultured Porphyromonas sp.]